MGFSTGTAMAAAARAAFRAFLTGRESSCVAVRLAVGYYLPVTITRCIRRDDDVEAVVVKDGGDDPDVNHKAEICVRLWLGGPGEAANPKAQAAGGEPWKDRFSGRSPRGSFPHGGILLVGGRGVGRVTKPGLPAVVGEPAVNPVPRRMLLENLLEEWKHFLSQDESGVSGNGFPDFGPVFPPNDRPVVWIPYPDEIMDVPPFSVGVEVSVPQGLDLSRHTLNPRLGVVGGLSILGTTGLVKPFSHEAYEETIQTAFHVARKSDCSEVVLSTGGKSEKYARLLFRNHPQEAFVQVADFFAFSVREAVREGFRSIVHSVFFGKAVKMAQGHRYTHAHKAAMDLSFVAECARRAGVPESRAEEIAQANTARHALELLKKAEGGRGIVEKVAGAVARRAAERSRRFAEDDTVRIRVLLFDYDGTLLADAEG